MPSEVVTASGSSDLVASPIATPWTIRVASSAVTPDPDPDPEPAAEGQLQLRLRG